VAMYRFPVILVKPLTTACAFLLQNFLDTVKIFVRADSEVQVELEKLTAARRTGFAILRFKVQKIDPASQKPKYLPGKFQF
jgi:hypothetical protein